MEHLITIQTDRWREDWYYQEEGDCYWWHLLFRDGPAEDFYGGDIYRFHDAFEMVEYVQEQQFKIPSQAHKYTQLLNTLQERIR